MSRRILKPKFFDRPTLRVARELLGKYLVRRIGRRIIARRIAEVEAYVGFTDFASQASRGKTKRNYVMFGKPGHWYVYFTYGMHWMVNVVTDRDGYPGAVLLRGVDGVSGPGRLTKFFKIDKQLNTKPVSRNTGLWIEDSGVKVSSRSIKRSKRVGINCDPVWQDKLWRFSI
jgi:DNA-3-methyladenine glycosylase